MFNACIVSKICIVIVNIGIKKLAFYNVMIFDIPILYWLSDLIKLNTLNLRSACVSIDIFNVNNVVNNFIGILNVIQ